MIKTSLLVTFLGVVVIALTGFAMIYSGTERAEVNTTGKSFSFGNYYFHDYSTNKTYLEGGTFTFYDCKSDTLEILDIYPPTLFDQSKLSNVYLAVWEGGIKPNIPENKPNALMQLRDPNSGDLLLPKVYQFSSVENTVSFELIADETYQNLGNSSTWTADFVRIHTFVGNADLWASGLLLIDIGIPIILLTNYLLAKARAPDRSTSLSTRFRADS